MAEVKMLTLTVFYDEQFFVGFFESVVDGKLSVCKYTFGIEPKDAEVYEFVLSEYKRLKFSPPVDAPEKPKAESPKRKQKEVKRQLESAPIGTKSQQALKLQHEMMKVERKTISKAQLKEQERHVYELRQQKKKEKHKGH